MPEPRNYQTEAIVIKKTKLGEADSILTLYTPQLGKIQGFARSLRKTRSKMAGHLELLTYSQVALVRGRNLCALYVVELVNQFTADYIENYPLFQLLLATIEHLCLANNQELVLRYFELNLLDRVGYRPQLRECVACHQSLTPTTNSFSPGAGGMLCPECAPSQPWSYPLSVNAQKVLRLFQNSDYSTASKVKIAAGLSGELEKVMSDYLKYLLEREVKSAAWLADMRGQRAQFNSHTLRQPTN